MELDLEHLPTVLSTENKTIDLRLSARLSTVKGLIKSTLSLNDGFKSLQTGVSVLRLRLTLRTLKSIYCKQILK